MLKWTGALAGVAAIGVGAGLGADMLIRPNAPTPPPQTSNGIVQVFVTDKGIQVTATTTTPTDATAASGTSDTNGWATVVLTTSAFPVKGKVSATAGGKNYSADYEVDSVSSPDVIYLIQPVAPVSTEVQLTSVHDTGPFIAFVKDGIWTRTAPLEPNIPVGHNAFAVKNRVYSPDRILYPLKRVDFSTSNRNPQNRGKSKFVRITWTEALDTVASELKRVKDTYGPSAVCNNLNGHGWASTYHSGGSWSSRFLALYGGYTSVVGNTTSTGWSPGGALTGFSGSTTNAADLVSNAKMIVHWATDTGMKSYNTYRQLLWLNKLKKPGVVKQIFIEPIYNDTAALYADEWWPIVPGTDEALAAAIAYVWITDNTVDTNFLNKNTVGFAQFKDYILGTNDKTPKTPAWASKICDPEGYFITADKITSTAREWASKPTYIICSTAGANRRHGAAEFVRMMVTLACMRGSIGVSGMGLAGLSFTSSGTNMPSLGTAIPSVTNPVTQTIRHCQFAEAINTGKATWTGMSGQNLVTNTYPKSGNSEIHLHASFGDGYMLNQMPGCKEHARARQNAKMEFTFCMTPWWQVGAQFADIVLPAKHVGERDDIVSWQNYLVYQHTLATPPGEPMNDYDIFVELAKRLGFDQTFTEGKTIDQRMQDGFTASGIPGTLADFKAKGYLKYDIADDVPTVSDAFKKFHDDPTNNKRSTPSGLIEIYVQRIPDFFGTNNPLAPAVPQFLPPPEGLDTTLAKTYPIIMTSPHPKFGRHSQWHNLSWHRDEYQMKTNGYATMRINPIDAAPRNIHTGDIVKLFNDHGAVLASAFVTQRIRPRVVALWEGSWFSPQEPGNCDSVDVAGAANVLIDRRQPEAVCDGMLNNALVEVQRLV